MKQRRSVSALRSATPVIEYSGWPPSDQRSFMIIENKKRLVVLALFVVLGLGLYANVVLNGIFIFDDFEYIVSNTFIQDLSNLDLSDPRQIGYLTFALNYAIGGEDPRGFHLVNVIIHIINAVLVFFLIGLLLRILSGSQREPDRFEQESVSFLTALIFLVHPVMTMAVSYVSQRFTSLATLFYLLSVLGYLSARVRFEQSRESRTAYALFGASLLCTLLAMRTKEISFTVPFVLAVFELLLFRDSTLGKRRFFYLIPFGSLLLIIPLSIFGPNLGLISRGEGIAEVTRREKIYDLTQRSAVDYLFTQFRVIVIYVRLLLLPINQCVIYNLKVSRSFFEPLVLFSFGFLSAVAATAAVVWRRASRASTAGGALPKLAALGILWFFLTLSIESSIIPIKDIMFEHRTYLPSVGFFAAVSVILVRGMRKARLAVRPPVLVGAVAAALAVILGTATVLRNQVWTDELMFWDNVVERNPDKAIGYHNRGNAYAKLQIYDRALEDMNWTIAAFPKNPMAALKSFEIADFTTENMAKTYMNRASVYLSLGLRELAEPDMKRAKDLVSRPPIDTDATRGLADQYAKRGAYQHAIEEYNKVLEWDPTDTNALMDRANAYSYVKNYEPAIWDLSRIILLHPDMALAWHNRGIAYAWSGKKDSATADFTKACGLGFQPACDSIELVK